MSDPKSSRQYTNEEAASIIARVLDRQNGEGGRISHDGFLETVRDIGVTTLELEEAVVAEARSRAERLVRSEENRRNFRIWIWHFVTYLVVSAACFVLDLRLTGGIWYFWVVLGWGLVVTIHGLRTLLPIEADRRSAARELAEREAEKSAVEARGGKPSLRPPNSRS